MYASRTAHRARRERGSTTWALQKSARRQSGRWPPPSRSCEARSTSAVAQSSGSPGAAHTLKPTCRGARPCRTASASRFRVARSTPIAPARMTGVASANTSWPRSSPSGNQPRGSMSVRQSNSLLAGLECTQLQALLLALVARHPGLADEIEAHVTRPPAMPVAGAPSAGPGITAVSATAAPPARLHRSRPDAGPYRRRMRAALRAAAGDYDDYGAMGGVVAALDELLDEVWPLVQAGDGRRRHRHPGGGH